MRFVVLMIPGGVRLRARGRTQGGRAADEIGKRLDEKKKGPTA